MGSGVQPVITPTYLRLPCEERNKRRSREKIKLAPVITAPPPPLPPSRPLIDLIQSADGHRHRGSEGRGAPVVDGGRHSVLLWLRSSRLFARGSGTAPSPTALPWFPVCVFLRCFLRPTDWLIRLLVCLLGVCRRWSRRCSWRRCGIRIPSTCVVLCASCRVASVFHLCCPCRSLCGAGAQSTRVHTRSPPLLVPGTWSPPAGYPIRACSPPPL